MQFVGRPRFLRAGSCESAFTTELTGCIAYNRRPGFVTGSPRGAPPTKSGAGLGQRAFDCAFRFASVGLLLG